MYGTLVAPSYANVQVLRAEKEQKIRELKAQQDAVNELDKLLQQFQDLKSAQELLTITLPNDPNIPQVVNTLNGLALINSLKIKSVTTQISPLQSLGNPSYVRNVGAVHTRINVVGPYENILGFISQIERNVRLMDPDSLNISPGKEETKTPSPANKNSPPTKVSPNNVFNIDIDLQAYYQDINAKPSSKATSTSR